MKGRFLAAVVLVLVMVPAHGCTTIRERIWMNDGHKLYKAQKYEEAIEQYKKIVAIDPNNWTANYQIAMSYLAMYHPGSTHPKDVEFAKKSVEEFEKLMKLQAPNTDTAEKVRNYYVALLRSAEMTDKVTAYYEDLLRKDPKNGQLYSQLAEIYAKKGDFENAVKLYERRTEVEPNSKEAWYTIGVVCWDKSYHGGPLVSDEERTALIDRGMKALEKALSIDPEYYDALAYEKLLYLEQSKVLSAQLKQAEAGEAYAKAGEVDKKLAELRKKKQAAPAPTSGG